MLGKIRILMKKSVSVFLLAIAISFPSAQAQNSNSADDLGTIIITADSDPIISAIRADALEHRGKVVSQTCTTTNQSSKRQVRRVSRYETEGPNAFNWQLQELLIDGKPASEKERDKAKKTQEKRNAERKAEEEERYSEFADLISDKEQIERLPPQDGMLRYRINRLPKRMAKDLPSVVVERLKPILWIADAEGEPYVRRLQVNLSDFRVYVVAKVNKADFDVYFERREDGYVKERKVDYDLSAKIVFRATQVSTGTVECDAGGKPVKYVSLKK
jgi:hypothetical protein